MKSVFFDLDGTLTDSGEGIMNCAAAAFQHLHMEVPQRSQLRIFVGPPLTDSFSHFGVPQDKVWDAIAAFRKRYAHKGKFENFPYKGISELLNRLNQSGYNLYVATSKPEPLAKEILEHFNLASQFKLVCGATMDGTRCTKEDVITYLLEKAGETDSPVMVGDTVYDVIGAAAHNIPTIGVSWGYGDVAEMEAAGACSIAHTPEQLFSILNTL